MQCVIGQCAGRLLCRAPCMRSICGYKRQTIFRFVLLALADLGKRRKQFKRLNEISNSAIYGFLDEIFYCVLHEAMQDPESRSALYFNMTKNIACVITPLKSEYFTSMAES